MVIEYTKLSPEYSRYSGWKRKLQHAIDLLEDAYANAELSSGEFPVIAYSKRSGRFAIFTR